MKIGDKVKYINKYGEKRFGSICIFVGDMRNSVSKTEYVGVVPVNGDAELWWVNKYSMESDLELVEEATYIPVPKHHKGDIRWVKENAERVDYKEVVVLENRDSDLQYKCYGEFRYGLKYGEIREDDDNDWIRYFTDDELLLEKPSEEKEKPE